MSVLISAGVSALIIVAGFLILNRRIERALSLDKTLSRVRDEVGALIRDLNQTTERNIVLIEERVVRLKELLGHADRQLDLLAREAERRENSLKTYTHLRKVVVPEQELPFATGNRETPRSTPEPVSLTEPVLTAVGGERTGRSAARSRVLELHRQGITPDLIAEKTDLPRGEVELIISLARR